MTVTQESPQVAWDRIAALASGAPTAVAPRAFAPGTPTGVLTVGAAAVSRLQVRDRESSWRSRARDNQLPPDDPDWLFWVLCCGRGFGKSWTGSNTLAEWAIAERGDYAAIGPTFSDARKIMTEGESGLLIALGDELENYNKSEFIIYLRNGSRIILASADVPDRIRGLNLRGAWLDELASMRESRELWDYALLPALRKGARPRAVITTTPRRGSPVLVELLDRAAAGDPLVHVTRGRTMDNAANLSDAFIASIYARFGGSTIGAQELEGELLEDAEGALVSSELWERWRIHADQVPDLSRVLIGVDPAVSNHETSDHTGIVAVGIGGKPDGWIPRQGLHLSELPHLYVLQDASLRASPETWATRALTLADQWDAEGIVAEVNQGGLMVSSTLKMVGKMGGLHVPRIQQVHASRGKIARAEPLVPMIEQGRVHILGRLSELETEWTTFVPGESPKSPDRMDAMVWGAVGLFPELGVKPKTTVRILA